MENLLTQMSQRRQRGVSIPHFSADICSTHLTRDLQANHPRNNENVKDFSRMWLLQLAVDNLTIGCM